jgi:hypothetical protein
MCPSPELAAELGIRLYDVIPQPGTVEQIAERFAQLKAEARKKYRIKAAKAHPDRNPGDAQAEARFKALTETMEWVESLSTPPQMVFYWKFPTVSIEGESIFETVPSRKM